MILPIVNFFHFSSRFERKYHVPTSPLLSLQWWRICLDEAQIVGGATTEVANMAQKLASVHRWAISGTPAQRGLSGTVNRSNCNLRLKQKQRVNSLFIFFIFF